MKTQACKLPLACCTSWRAIAWLDGFAAGAYPTTTASNNDKQPIAIASCAMHCLDAGASHTKPRPSKDKKNATTTPHLMPSLTATSTRCWVCRCDPSPPDTMLACSARLVATILRDKKNATTFSIFCQHNEPLAFQHCNRGEGVGA